MSGTTLQSYSEFETRLSPHLAMIKRSQRRRVLRRVYELAKQKAKMEDLRNSTLLDARELRASRLSYGRVGAHIKNALECIAQARRAAEYPGLLKYLEIDRAEHLLKEAAADVRWIAREMIPAGIHPKLQTASERSSERRLLLRDFDSLFPGFGIAQIDHWFIKRMLEYLASIPSANGQQISPGDRDMIVASTFEAAFSTKCEVGRVKDVRLRSQTRNETKDQSLHQN